MTGERKKNVLVFPNVQGIPMSHSAPKFDGYPYSGGGYQFYYSGQRGKTYKASKHSEKEARHSLAKKNPKQNKPEDNPTEYAGSGSGTVAGVITNEFQIDGPSLAPPQPVDRNGPSTGAVAMGHTSGTAPHMTIKKTY